MASAKWKDAAEEGMGGSPKEPKKEISHIVVRKAHNGGHIMTHHHTHPETHPPEHHTTKGDDAMVAHLLANAGTGENAAPEGQEAPSVTPSAPMVPSGPSMPMAGA